MGLLIPPLTSELVREAIHRLRVAPLLHGFRGAPARDIDSLVRLVLDRRRTLSLAISPVERNLDTFTAIREELRALVA
ncbi:hypothetical protein FHX82_006446 [Amycolatopsis bartoniae]|uniref:hypothetical protein n=1 Tax=Amycolatopsis bartoniae TaxID=941986 RepID=UPI0011962DA0|nr:hypothetical protein [Amycolatopsis bartoniae]MBB2939360.1 hypothetical protein [Amycolatopsis bartoniae]TVT06717.1 hypothetical protein FNH07_19105 [Amycolatopsis bartoniae]